LAFLGLAVSDLLATGTLSRQTATLDTKGVGGYHDTKPEGDDGDNDVFE